MVLSFKGLFYFWVVTQKVVTQRVSDVVWL